MFSIHTRQIMAGLVLPILIFMAVALVFVGQVWPHKVLALRLAVVGGTAPIYRVLMYPQRKIEQWETVLHGVTDVLAENVRLRQENQNLQRWHITASSLEIENMRLKSILHWGNDPKLADVSGWVIRDESGPYLRAVLLDIGDQKSVHTGSVAVDTNGLVGRVSEVGVRVLRILLITDATSRIPVHMLASHADAIMVGNNTPYPRLMYYAQNSHPFDGERIETRAQIGMTGGIAVGYVKSTPDGGYVVVSDADLAHLDMVRAFDNATMPDAPLAEGRVKEHPPIHSSLLNTNKTFFPRGLKRIWPFSHMDH